MTKVQRSEIVGLATRYETGLAKLVDALQRSGAPDRATAARVAAYYIKHKLAKIDVHVGQFNVKHGAFLDADVVARAVAQVANV